MRSRHALPFSCLLAGCSLFGSSTTLDSSMTLAAAGKVTLLVRESPANHLVVRLRGLGPGGVTFEAKAADGVVVSRGVLTAGSLAECQTNTGELTFAFAADERGGSFDYSAYGEHGLEVRMPASTRAR
jgi:hypothetical protein